MSYQLREIPESIRSCKNTSGSTIVKGSFVKLKTTPTVPNEVVLCTAATDPAYGVTMQDIANNAYGDVMIRGLAQVRGGAAVAVADRIAADADGEGVPAGSGEAVYGVALTVGADNVLFECELLGPAGPENAV